ncbi:cation:proton antiporter, partial [Streptomyces scabiei]
NLSKNFRIKIGSESLFNDGVGVVLFVIFLNLADQATPNFTPFQVVGLMLWEGLGSIVLGITLGWIADRLMHTTEDYKIEILLT